MLLGTPTTAKSHNFYILDDFNATQGTYINKSKSEFFFFNTPILIQQNVARILGFRRSTLPLKYIKIPLVENDLKLST